jgi:hypothetical protein
MVAGDDAVRWWHAIRDDEPAARGISLEFKAATNSARMRRSAGGTRTTKRLYWWLSVPLGFVKQPALLMPVEPPEPEP